METESVLACMRVSLESLCRFYANAKSDAVQEAALDLHSSSTIPSSIQRRRSQEAGSEGTGPINHRRTRIKAVRCGWRRTTTKRSGARGAIKMSAAEGNCAGCGPAGSALVQVMRATQKSEQQNQGGEGGQSQIFLENLEEELMICFGSPVLMCIWNILL